MDHQLPLSHVHLLLDASGWVGIQDSERTSVMRALSERARALDAANRGESFSAVANHDEALREAFRALHTRVSIECRIPAREDALHTYLTGMLCTGPDAAAAERSLASRTATEAVSSIREMGFEGKTLVRIVIAVLWGLRRALLEDGGTLTYRNALSLHRAVKAVFSSSDLAQNVRRARIVALAARGTMEFEGIWEMMRAYENSVIQKR